MNVDASGVTAQVEEPASKTNVFQRIAGVLFAPAKTFQEIARRPDILAPLVVIVLVGYATTALIQPRMDWDAMIVAQQEAMQAKNPNLQAKDMEQMGKVGIAVAKTLAWFGPIIMVAWYALMAGVLLLAFRLMGHQGTYKQAFSVSLYAWIPLLLASIVLTIVVVSRGTFDPTEMATVVTSNPAFLVDMKEQPVLFALLSSIDLFTIWTIVLLAIGWSYAGGTTITKSAIIVVTFWVLLIVIKLGFAALTASAQAAA